MKELWAGLKANVTAGTRLAMFMPVRIVDFRISAGHYALLVTASFMAWLLGGMARSGFPGDFDPGALVVGLGQVPLVLLACVLAAAVLRESSLALVLAVLITATDPVFELIAVVLFHGVRLPGMAPHAAWLYAVFIAWGVAAVVRALVLAAGWRGRESFAAAAYLIGLLFVLALIFPRSELWTRNSEMIAAMPSQLMNEEVFHTQAGLLDGALADLEPERAGVEDVYFVGVAPDALVPGLVEEAHAVRRLVEERFDAADRTLLLANSTATLTALPIASATNLSDTLAQIGDTINPDEDIVFLFLNGAAPSDGALAFRMPPLQLSPVNPTMIARMLDDSGIKWRVIVISACAAGGFIEPLKNDNTLVITASDSGGSSPACETGAERSWWSRAFEEALRSTRSLADAFAVVRDRVAERERSAGVGASEARISMGSAIREKLKSLEKRLDSGDPNRPSVRASLVRSVVIR